MPQPIRFSSPSKVCSLEISAIDEQLFPSAEKRALPKTGSLLQKIIWWADDTRPRSVLRVPLLAEVRVILSEIERDSEFLPYAYIHSCKIIYKNGNAFMTSDSGGSSGHRFVNDPDHAYAIIGGIGVCDLEKWGIDPRGQGVLLGTSDCRHMKAIETVNTGTVTIKKRKIKTNLGPSFAELQTFLERQTAEVISISRSKE